MVGATGLSPAFSLLLTYVLIVLVHTGLQEHFRKKNVPVAIDDAAELLPNIGERWPSVDVVIPIYNEEPGVLEACLESFDRQDYKGEMRFLVVDDGSSNFEALLPVYRKYQERPDWAVLVWRDHGNLGKRRAQDAAIYGASPTSVTTLAPGGLAPREDWAGSKAEFILTVDSDTVVEPDGVSWILTPFLDEAVAAVTGNVAVVNRDMNRLTRLIDERYNLLFSHERAAQSSFGMVFCCAGPFSAYRTRDLDEVWSDYLERRFLRRPCTYGDDLQLTNLMLERGLKSVMQPRAKAATIAPTTLRAYVRQQWRWNRSFYRQFRWILPVLGRNRSAYQVLDLIARAVPPLLLAAALASVLFDLATLEPTRLTEHLLALGGMVLAGFSTVLWQTRSPSFALLYGLVYVLLLIPTRIWALCTLNNSDWGTRTSAGGKGGPTGVPRAALGAPVSPSPDCPSPRRD